MRQCFRYDGLYVPGTCQSLLVFHLLRENCLCGFVQINGPTIQYNTIQNNTLFFNGLMNERKYFQH